MQDLFGGSDACFPSAMRCRKIAAGAGLAGEEEPAVDRRRKHRPAVSHSGICI